MVRLQLESEDNSVGRVLIVDDDPSIRELLGELLVDEGYEVFVASNGLSAVGIAQERQPHVILMDLMMPVLNGIEATHRIKSDPDTAWIRIIVMSAGINLRTAAGQVPADSAIGKPFDLDTVLADIALNMQQADEPG